MGDDGDCVFGLTFGFFDLSALSFDLLSNSNDGLVEMPAEVVPDF